MSFTAIKAPTQAGFARIVGTFREPALEVHIHARLPHPTTPRLTMKDWVKSFGTARWDAHKQAWLLHGLNSPTPTSVLLEAGIALDWDDRPEEFAEVSSLDELAVPIAKLSENGRTVLVRPRLAGFDHAKELLGLGAVWDKERRFFRTPVSDVIELSNGNHRVRPGVHWPGDAIEASFAEHRRVPVRAEIAEIARTLSSAISVDAISEDELRKIQAEVGEIPTGGREPFAYQVAGALSVAAGRACLFDEPGVGKSAGALLSARILGARRTIIVVPPLLTTNWRREIAHSALCPDENVVTFRSGRKEPELPDAGAVIISDSLLAARPHTFRRLLDWRADVMIVDEVHRIKTIGSARGEVVLDLAQSVKHPPFALTGTPMFKSPHEIVTLLELSRMMTPVFGGRHQFLSDFCYQDNFGGFRPRNSALHRLHATLREEVWVRRRKKDVLSQLPSKIREAMLLELPLGTYREAHKEVISKVRGFLSLFVDQNGREPTSDEVNEWVRLSSFTLISQLRQAAGLTKVKAAAEIIVNHISETGWETDDRGKKVFHRPLLVWVHHKSVAAAMYEALPRDIGETGMIGGDTSEKERDRLVDQFQEGLIPVLVCSIAKAGFGITLVRSEDALFVETEWTPALIKQAEDRQHRAGATATSVRYTTLIALGTLDETVQRVLGRKVEVLEAAIGDTDDSVAVMDMSDTRGLQDIVAAVVDEALIAHRARRN